MRPSLSIHAVTARKDTTVSIPNYHRLLVMMRRICLREEPPNNDGRLMSPPGCQRCTHNALDLIAACSYSPRPAPKALRCRHTCSAPSFLLICVNLSLMGSGHAWSRIMSSISAGKGRPMTFNIKWLRTKASIQYESGFASHRAMKTHIIRFPVILWICLTASTNFRSWSVILSRLTRDHSRASP